MFIECSLKLKALFGEKFAYTIANFMQIESNLTEIHSCDLE